MIREEQIKALFRAYAEKNDASFLKTAETIISEELAANHHSFATELRRVLAQARPLREPLAARQLTSLPRDRRNGDPLIHLREGKVTQDQIIFSELCGARITRIIEEHRKRLELAKHGYTPKNKILFWGPPGCGKTYTAHYLGHELGLPVGVVKLNTVISSFLGDTASHLQRVFDLASSTPMVLLLDEVDAVAKDRDDPNDVGELKRVVNSLLQAMDSFESSKSLVIAASNHQYLLDPAIWRRFDEIVQFPLPGLEQRERYLRLLLNGVEFKGSFQSLSRAVGTQSYSDVKRVVLEAVKTMIMEGTASLDTATVLFHFKRFKNDLSSAKSREKETNPRGKKK
jgi:SpoVK/Ycf46/Vps4 family AAA+-type ATPase